MHSIRNNIRYLYESAVDSLKNPLPAGDIDIRKDIDLMDTAVDCPAEHPVRETGPAVQDQRKLRRIRNLADPVKIHIRRGPVCALGIACRDGQRVNSGSLRKLRCLVRFCVIVRKLSFLELRCVRNASELRLNRSSESVGDFDELQDFRDMYPWSK